MSITEPTAMYTQEDMGVITHETTSDHTCANDGVNISNYSITNLINPKQNITWPISYKTKFGITYRTGFDITYNNTSYNTDIEFSTSTYDYKIQFHIDQDGKVISPHWEWTRPDSRDQFRNRIRRQLAPNVITSRSADFWKQHHKESEQRARELLQSLITPEEYRKYLRKGFITVQGPSGMVYQIFGGHKMMKCFVKDKSGKLIWHEDICIVFSGPYHSLPYTDWVIMRKMMVENDEFGMRKTANIFRKIHTGQAAATNGRRAGDYFVQVG